MRGTKLQTSAREGRDHGSTVLQSRTAMATCSFCGLGQEKVGELFAPDATNGVALQAARICRGCVRLCAGAFGDEDEGNGGAGAEDSDDEKSALHEVAPAVLVDWTPFQFDGLDLEWHAIRTNTHTWRPMNLVTVRGADGAQSMPLLFPQEPTTEEIKIAARAEDRKTERQAQETRERHSGGDGAGLTWTSEPAAVVEVKPEVLVSVRRRGDQGGGTAVALSVRGHEIPSQREAEFAAQVAWSTLTKKN